MPSPKDETKIIEWKKRLSDSHKGKSNYWLIGKKLSDNHKSKLSSIMKNYYINNPQAKKDRAKWASGRIYSIERNKKISDSLRGKPSGMLGKHLSEETKKKISEANRGKKRTAEYCKRMEGSRTGAKSSLYGTHLSEKRKKRLSDLFRGDNGPGWKGGIYPVKKLIRSSSRYKNWRSQVFIRDDFTCQKCKVGGGRLNVHHVKPFIDLLQEAKECLPLFPLYESAIMYSPLWEISVGITYCEKCHNKIHKKKK